MELDESSNGSLLYFTNNKLFHAPPKILFFQVPN